jgi:hypothetical protein
VIRNYGKLQLGCSNKILERLFAIAYFLMHGACPGILHADNENLASLPSAVAAVILASQ